MEHDLIEGVIYLPENLFYNTSAPGIVLVLNNRKPEDRRNQIFLVNASLSFEKGDPKNFIPDGEIDRIAKTFLDWEEVEKFSRVVSLEEIAKNDFNISPSRYIHVAEAEEFRPIAEMLGELGGVWKWKPPKQSGFDASFGAVSLIYNGFSGIEVKVYVADG